MNCAFERCLHTARAFVLNICTNFRRIIHASNRDARNVACGVVHDVAHCVAHCFAPVVATCRTDTPTCHHWSFHGHPCA
jgi:hypothetical protein